MKHAARCHCGAVEIVVAAWPARVTDCNCSLCHRYGVLWAYYASAQIVSLPPPSLTHTYAWNGRHADFHRCRSCGCITHWMPRAPDLDRHGVNARLFPPQVLQAAQVEHRDGAARPVG